MTGTLQLRTRLAIAGSLLVATTVATGVWSATAFRRVSRVVEQTVTDNERMTDATATLSGTLEREDDAMLLVLSDVAKGAIELAHKRDEVTASLAEVARQLDSPDERAVAEQLRDDIAAYQRAVDELVADARAADARMRYHETVNPALRRAVATANHIRDQHFRSSQSVAEWAGDQSTRSMEIVAAISIAGLLLLVLIVIHLARVVMLPIGEMTRAVQAIRRGDFTQRVSVRQDDELGRLGAGFNRMADDLEEFRRTNVGEVIHAKETLEATLEALPDAVLVIDRDRKISAENPQATVTLGPSRSRGLDDVPIPAATRAAVDDVLGSGVAHDAAVDLARTIPLPLGDSRRRLLPRIVPIAGRRGAVLVLSDVTDLVRLDEMRLELVAVASHELRTPVTTMRMTLLMLQERAARYDQRDRELVATALVGVEQLSALVNEFLDLTQIEAGQLRLQWGRLSLRELVDQGARAIAVDAEQRRITLAVEHAMDPATLLAGDRARLATVVSNLLTNAVKYTPSGGRIVVRGAVDAKRRIASIQVDDTGPGVPAEYRERVFERFFRVEHARGGQLPPAGVGIGLYIARQVIEAHRGSIRCEASPLGGARFAVTIPIDAEQWAVEPT